MCDASSKFAMYATCVPFGDHAGDEIDAPLGVSMARVAPVRGSTSERPEWRLVVSVRARFAFVSICNPPRFTCAAPNLSMSPRSLPGVRRNHFRSGLGVANEMSTRGAMMMRSITAGGLTYVSVRRICCGSQDELLVVALPFCEPCAES